MDLTNEQVSELMESHGDTLAGAGMDEAQALLLLDAALTTMALHTGRASPRFRFRFGFSLGCGFSFFVLSCLFIPLTPRVANRLSAGPRLLHDRSVR
jgi:hypothetical protein